LEAIMASNDPVKCPLCRGLGRVRREELLRILTDPNLDGRIAQLISELTQANTADREGVKAVQASPGNFEKDLHSWNPSQPMWRRSPKE